MSCRDCIDRCSPLRVGEVPKAPVSCGSDRFQRYKTRALARAQAFSAWAPSTLRQGTVTTRSSAAAAHLPVVGTDLAASDSSKGSCLAGEQHRQAATARRDGRVHVVPKRLDSTYHRSAAVAAQITRRNGKGPRPRPRQVRSSAIRKRDRRGGRPRARRLGGGPARARGAAADDKTVDGRRPRARG